MGKGLGCRQHGGFMKAASVTEHRGGGPRRDDGRGRRGTEPQSWQTTLGSLAFSTGTTEITDEVEAEERHSELSRFIHSINIYREPTMYWALVQARGSDGEQNQQGPWPHGGDSRGRHWTTPVFAHNHHCRKCYEGGAREEGKGCAGIFCVSPEIHSPPYSPHRASYPRRLICKVSTMAPLHWGLEG